MFQLSKLLELLGLAVIALALIFGVQYFFKKDGRSPMYSQASSSAFKLLSSAFQNGGPIPGQYTCKGQNISPPLHIVGKPMGTKSFVLIMHDPDAVSGDFLHWLMWDIPANSESIATSSVPVGALQGHNDAGQAAYMGPCPPSGTGTHSYIFELYALDTSLSLPPGAGRQEVQDAMASHILDKAELTGSVKAD